MSRCKRCKSKAEQVFWKDPDTGNIESFESEFCKQCFNEVKDDMFFDLFDISIKSPKYPVSDNIEDIKKDLENIKDILGKIGTVIEDIKANKHGAEPKYLIVPGRTGKEVLADIETGEPKYMIVPGRTGKKVVAKLYL